ncbi:hypothetical protein ACF1BN_03395 [Streptomyces sp. NPDC014861]|uniref:hypothetical protein n=1 Tax=Streptomyces sp. NPDC014861 TaxID=3364923 RepID=UPI0036FACB88
MLALTQADAVLLRLTMDDLDAVLSDSVIRVYEEYSEGDEWALPPLLPALLIAERRRPSSSTGSRTPR